MNQPIHAFRGGKGLGIQQGMSVWVGSPKSAQGRGLNGILGKLMSILWIHGAFLRSELWTGVRNPGCGENRQLVTDELVEFEK